MAMDHFQADGNGRCVSLDPEQQTALLSLLHVAADGEIIAEQARCRLFEVREFDPYDAFKKLQGGWQRGWISGYDLQSWLSAQPHNLNNGKMLRDDVYATISPYLNMLGELRYEGFLRLLHPKDPKNLWLKELAMARGQTVCSDSRLQPEVAYRLCQLFESEIDVCRHLRLHQKNLRDLGVDSLKVLKFLEVDQGVCADIGGLVSPAVLRHTLVEQLQLLNHAQCDALLRRINPTGAVLAPFDELAKMISLPLPGAGIADNVLPSPGRSFSPSRTALMSPRAYVPPSHQDRGLYDDTIGSPAPPLQQLSHASLGTEVRSFSTRPYSPMCSLLNASWGNTSLQDNPYGDSFVRSRNMSPQHSPRFSKDYKFADSPATRSYGVASTQASTADNLSPPRSSPFAMHSPLRSGAAMRTSSTPTSQRFHSPSTPVRSAGLTSSPWAPSPLVASHLSPSPITQRSSSPLALPIMPWTETKLHHRVQPDLKAVFSVIVRQAELDSRIEDAKAVIPCHISVEAVFHMLDRFRKGYVADTDLWQFLQDFGATASFGSLCALVHEVQLHLPRESFVTPGRLSLRELGTLIYQIGTKEYEAMLDAATDSEALSILYSRAYANASGESLTAAMQYHVYRLIETAARAAEELDRARKQFVLLSNNDVLTLLSDTFLQIADARNSFSREDLRRVLFSNDFFVSEQELGLLWRRYANRNINPVSFSDFAHQLKPRTLQA